ncbi:MAG: ribosome-binding factor A [Nitriliruptoraceae bacterium]|jgi:ribosome-binding factor A
MRRRNPRIDHTVAEALSDLIARDFNDPRLTMVSITEAQVSQDSKEAIIFWTVPDREVLSPDGRGRVRKEDLPTPYEAAAAIEAARPRLQKLLASKVSLRNTPVLRFEMDPVRQTADRVEELLRDMRQQGG